MASIQNLTLTDGQVAATATEITAGPASAARRVNVVFTNVGGQPETLVVTVVRNGGTARRLARAALADNEQFHLTGVALNGTDSLKATTSNAASVDYVVSIAPEQSEFAARLLDANGAEKVYNGGLSGNQTITGDLTVSGGDVDAGSSGAAGTVDIFPSTAAKGKLQITAADASGNTTTTLTTATMAQATTLTLADPLASAGTIDPIQVAVVTLTSAQLLSLHNTPISLVSAPGANKAIVIDSVELRHAGGTAYASVGAGDDLTLKYTNGSGAQLFTTLETTGLLDQTAAQVRHYPGNTIGEVVPVANALVCANLGGAITTGNYDLLLRLRYRVVATNFS